MHDVDGKVDRVYNGDAGEKETAVGANLASFSWVTASEIPCSSRQYIKRSEGGTANREDWKSGTKASGAAPLEADRDLGPMSFCQPFKRGGSGFDVGVNF